MRIRFGTRLGKLSRGVNVPVTPNASATPTRLRFKSAARVTTLALGAFLSLTSAAPSVFAVPAAPGAATLRQSDGTTFSARLRGDEFFHWHEVGGRPIVQNAANAWVYAAPQTGGGLRATTAIVGRTIGARMGVPFRPIVPQAAIDARLSRDAVNARYAKRRTERQGVQGGKLIVPPSGVGNVPVILVTFSDTSPTNSAAEFNTLLFGAGASMKTLYSQMSGGKFTVGAGPSGVVGWYKASKPHDYYGTNVNGRASDAHAAELAREAVAAADAAGFNFSSYDQDNDGEVDVVNIVHQGTGEEVVGSPPTNIWSHQWDFRSAGVGAYTTRSGKSVSRYIMQPERLGENMTTIGVFCHEYGHAMGLPDLYDIDYSSEGIGNWSLMAGGSWGGGDGSSPTHMDAWCKSWLRWVTPTVVSATTLNAAIPDAETHSFAYKLLVPGSPSEYYLIENRQKTGFDASLPGSGLAIYHVDDAVGGSNRDEWYPGHTNFGHYHVAIEQADGKFSLELGNGRGDAGDAYPGATGNRAFDGASVPSCTAYNGIVLPGVVRNISDSAPTMHADFVFGATPDVTPTPGPTVTPTPDPKRPGNDDFANAYALSSNPGTTQGTNVDATTQNGEPAPSGETVWWKWTAPWNGKITIDTLGSSFDTTLDVYLGNSVDALTLLVDSDDIDDSTFASRVALDVQKGTTYHVRVRGVGGESGDISLQWSFAPDASAYNVSGRVFASIGTPKVGLSGVQMTVYRVSDKKTFTTLTGSDGAWSISNLSADTYYIGPTSPNMAYAYLPTSAQPRAPQPLQLTAQKPNASPLDFWTRPQLTGTVYDSSAQLRLSGITIKAVRSGDNAVSSTVSDKYGNYVLPLDPGTYTLSAAKPGAAWFRLEAVGLVAAATSTTCVVPTGLATSALKRDFRASGVIGNVVNASGRAQPNIPIGIYAWNDWAQRTAFIITRTNQWGYYLFDGALPGSYLVAPVPASKGGVAGTFAPFSRPATLQSGQVILDKFVYTPPTP